MNRRSVLKLATTSLILAAPAIKASTGVFRPATTGNRYVVHVDTQEVPDIWPHPDPWQTTSKAGHQHQISLFDRHSRINTEIDTIYTGEETERFAIGKQLGAAVERHKLHGGAVHSACYPGATFNIHGDASYEDGRYYPKLIEMPTRFSKTVRMS